SGAIGHTPLVALKKIEKLFSLQAHLLAKVESLNPGGSIKDRTALYLIQGALKRGEISDGATIIEPTSGNTGIGLAMLCTVYGFRAVIVMPDTMSEERIRTIQAFGGEVILMPGALGMKGCIEKAQELHEKTPNSFIPSQFDNPDNARAHYETTGPELLRDTDGQIDYFVAAFGTGGTVSGTGRYLKEQNEKIRVIGVEPASSPLVTQGHAGPHKIQGIGANFIPAVFDPAVTDEILTVTDEDAFSYGRLLGKTEGILAGISSGAALAAAVSVASRPEAAGKTVVVILPDTGDRYLSTELFTD
ncbi:MAG: cysteine synthase A, partial [Lachnospiraceae bacterium]|nr:cysteine synthase A [Lachnospiraceae bacterium]